MSDDPRSADPYAPEHREEGSQPSPEPLPEPAPEPEPWPDLPHAAPDIPNFVLEGGEDVPLPPENVA